jgi:uncharacterized protein YcbK (DUF882 family)
MATSQAQKLERFIDSLGLRHFKGAELTPYLSKTRRGVVNSVPPEKLWPNIVETLVVLDEVRERLGKPITLTSTYRSPAYNQAVGGARFSQHLVFNATDIQAKGAKPAEVAELAKGLRGKRFKNPLTGKPFTFKGGIGRYATFVHIDTRGHNADW